MGGCQCSDAPALSENWISEKGYIVVMDHLGLDSGGNGGELGQYLFGHTSDICAQDTQCLIDDLKL